MAVSPADTGEFSMPGPLANRVMTLLKLAPRSNAAVAASLSGTLLIFTLVAPLTASCQRRQGDPDRGIAELRALVSSSEGRPPIAELQRIESAYAQTRAGALARF